MASDLMTLDEFDPDRVYYVSVVVPDGKVLDLRWKDDGSNRPVDMDLIDLDDRCPDDDIPPGWLELEGTVDADGVWTWDGHADAVDFDETNVVTIKAYRPAPVILHPSV